MQTMTLGQCLGFALGALLFSGGCSSASVDAFEGEVDKTAESDSGAIATIRYFVKGHRIRMESSAGRSSATQIIDISTNDVFVLDDSRRTYRAVNDPSAARSVRHAIFDVSGKQVVLTKASHVERAKEPATMFVVPPGYTLVK